MFTTGAHSWLSAAAGCYCLALIFCFFRKETAGRALVAAGFGLHSLYLVGRGWLGGVFIPNPILEGPFYLPWCLALIAAASGLKKEKHIMSWVLVLVVIFSLISLFYAKGMIPPTPKKLSAWAPLFFALESMAHALFYAGAILACAALAGKDRSSRFTSFVVWGFITYTAAQVTGAIWCFEGWGNTFSWGTRHLGSAAIWTFFAAVLHLQFIAKWKRKSAFFVIAGGVLVFFISYGNYFHEMYFPRIGG